MSKADSVVFYESNSSPKSHYSPEGSLCMNMDTCSSSFIPVS